MKRTDSLPKQACRLCLANLELCYQFHETVAEAEKQLLTFERLAALEFEEPERSCGDFQSPNGQISFTAQDSLEGALKTVAEVEASDDELKTFPEQVRTKDSPVMNDLDSDSSKTYPELSFPSKTLDEENRTISSNEAVCENAESSRYLFHSWRLHAPQNIQQSKYDSLVSPQISGIPQTQKDMIPSSFYGTEFTHLRVRVSFIHQKLFI